jgi:hypothetical protein
MPHVVATAVEHNLPPVWVLQNNCAIGAICDLQRVYHDGRENRHGFHERNGGPRSTCGSAVVTFGITTATELRSYVRRRETPQIALASSIRTRSHELAWPSAAVCRPAFSPPVDDSYATPPSRTEAKKRSSAVRSRRPDRLRGT